jgi:tetratricopeptide (TPR) repeat protein
MIKILPTVLTLLMSTVCNLPEKIARRCVHRRAIFLSVLFALSSATFCSSLWAASLDGPQISQPSDNDAIVYRITFSSAAINSATNGTPQQHLDAAKQALISFRNTANPRDLGDAERELAALTDAQRNTDFYFYRASLRQSLHLFDEALDDLDTISVMQGDNLESLMMRFTISFVTGKYQAAEQACEALKHRDNNLYAASCAQQLQAATGDPSTAYRDLKHAMAEFGVLSDRRALIWASGTLADIAERAGRDDTLTLWQLALQLNRDDLYTRARLAAALLAHGDYAQVLSVTEDYMAVDALAVSRAIAQKQLGDGDALITTLRERFDEARWRGEILHKRAYAQFLLDIEQQPAAALAMAEMNWTHQREWPDVIILARARDAMNNKVAP